MDTTTITISRKNWRWLNSLKREPGESFSDVLDRLEAHYEGKPLEPSIDTSETVETLPNELDLPGTGDTYERRRDTVVRLYNYLRQHGTAEKDDLLELVDVDEVGYSSKESFWANAIKGRDSLKALPGVQPPTQGGRTWRYTGE